jgi:hypothetical protein
MVLELVFALILVSGSSSQTTAGSWGAGGGYWRTSSCAQIGVGTASATFYITGVQLEKGLTATSFDYRPYGTELQLCQRYYEKSYNLDVVAGTVTYAGFEALCGSSDGGSNASYGLRFKVPKRVSPTLTFYSSTAGTAGLWDYARSGASGTTTVNIDQMGMNGGNIYSPVGASYVGWFFDIRSVTYCFVGSRCSSVLPIFQVFLQSQTLLLHSPMSQARS